MDLYRVTLVGVVAALAMTGSSASAQNAADVRCILASNFFIKAGKEEKARHAAESAAFFYLGRLDRFSPAQMKPVVAQQRKAITAANVAAAMNDCARKMEASVRLFESATK